MILQNGSHDRKMELSDPLSNFSREVILRFQQFAQCEIAAGKQVYLVYLSVFF